MIRLASQSRQSPTGGSAKDISATLRPSACFNLADAGGSNSCRSRVWKARLQEQLCDTCGLAVTVCHYPSGCFPSGTRSNTGCSATSA
ncbi:ISAzo13-like element transposase-related protein [Polaromonas hydrogenivorans]|uniref:ISAzo13-like element transposase-related protein n=1 Tax=Polaromonas hydrogenivorans TaxID=335476 RepID=UPI0039F00939